MSDAIKITTKRAENDYDGTRIFGTPSDWCYEEKAPEMLMQYDPLDNEMGFLDSQDGYLYLFFGKDKNNLENITIKQEYS